MHSDRAPRSDTRRVFNTWFRGKANHLLQVDRVKNRGHRTAGWDLQSQLGLVHN